MVDQTTVDEGSSAEAESPTAAAAAAADPVAKTKLNPEAPPFLPKLCCPGVGGDRPEQEEMVDVTQGGGGGEQEEAGGDRENADNGETTEIGDSQNSVKDGQEVGVEKQPEETLPRENDGLLSGENNVVEANGVVGNGLDNGGEAVEEAVKSSSNGDELNGSEEVQELGGVSNGVETVVEMEANHVGETEISDKEKEVEASGEAKPETDAIVKSEEEVQNAPCTKEEEEVSVSNAVDGVEKCSQAESEPNIPIEDSDSPSHIDMKSANESNVECPADNNCDTKPAGNEATLNEEENTKVMPGQGEKADNAQGNDNSKEKASATVVETDQKDNVEVSKEESSTKETVEVKVEEGNEESSMDQNNDAESSIDQKIDNDNENVNVEEKDTTESVGIKVDQDKAKDMNTEAVKNVENIEQDNAGIITEHNNNTDSIEVLQEQKNVKDLTEVNNENNNEQNKKDVTDSNTTGNDEENVTKEVAEVSNEENSPKDSLEVIVEQNNIVANEQDNAKENGELNIEQTKTNDDVEEDKQKMSNDASDSLDKSEVKNDECQKEEINPEEIKDQLGGNSDLGLEVVKTPAETEEKTIEEKLAEEHKTLKPEDSIEPVNVTIENTMETEKGKNSLEPDPVVPRRSKNLSGSNEAEGSNNRDSYQLTKEVIEESLSFIKSKLSSPTVDIDALVTSNVATGDEAPEPAKKEVDAVHLPPVPVVPAPSSDPNPDYEPVDLPLVKPVDAAKAKKAVANQEEIIVVEKTCQPEQPTSTPDQKPQYAKECIPPVRPMRVKKGNKLEVPDWKPPSQSMMSYIFGCFGIKK